MTIRAHGFLSYRSNFNHRKQMEIPRKNLLLYLREGTKLLVTITQDPLSDVVFGAGKALDNLSILKEVMINS